MKISGPGPVRPGSAARTKKKAGDKDQKFEVDSPTEESAASSVAGSGPIAAVDSLLALQEVPDATTGRSRAVLRGVDLLDNLDEIRLGLLVGTIPHSKLSALMNAVRESREEVDDPRLAAVLDEIEVRASVELAKLGRFT